MAQMKVGDQVKWANPVGDESEERFIVIEVNGDRCFIQYICDFPIPPVTLAKVADLVVC